MSVIICTAHQRTSQTKDLLVNLFVCMNKYCPESFQTLCIECKENHRDHGTKVLNLQSLHNGVQYLISAPFKEVTNYVIDSIQIMKKLQLIQQFQKKIDDIYDQIRKYASQLVEETEMLIHQYVLCKVKAEQLIEILDNLGHKNNLDKFRMQCPVLLTNIDYNFKKSKMEYMNNIVRNKLQTRRLVFQNAERKIEEVKDYCMKIIEVILHKEQGDFDEEDIDYHKKYYEKLKKELLLDANTQHSKDRKDRREQEIVMCDICVQTDSERMNQIEVSRREVCAQTDSQWIQQFELNCRESQIKVEQMRRTLTKTEADLGRKMSELMNHKKASSKQKQLNRKKLQIIKYIYTKILANQQLQQQQQSLKDNCFFKLLETAKLKPIKACSLKDTDSIHKMGVIQ